MIDIQAKVHDKFSVEFKIAFLAQKRLDVSDFEMNTWLFIPNSLDINPLTYEKNHFYRDIKSYLRLVTPVYLLRNLARPDSRPFSLLRDVFQQLADHPDHTTAAAYESRLKLFAVVFKSALRDEVIHLQGNQIEADQAYLCREYVKNTRSITTTFRELRRVINVSTVAPELLNYYRFADEFISNVVEQHTYKLLKAISARPLPLFAPLREELEQLLREELAYKQAQGYLHVLHESPVKNRDFLFRAGLLKKYIEGELFLTARKKSNTFVAEQVLFSIAAGVAMIFATVVSFSFQKKYGNFTMPLFVALIVSYMLKDRIKDLMRYYFAHKLGGKYFDNKIQISRNGEPIGWSKEGFDFITDNKVPREVMELRNRSALLCAENRNVDEKIILYRKRVQMHSKQLTKDNGYPFPGIHDIIRFNLSEFMRKMDNPEVPLCSLNEQNEFCTTHGEKIYYLNFIMQFKYEEQLEYRRYRIVLNQLGIKKIETF